MVLPRPSVKPFILNAVAGKGQGQLSCSYDLGTSSPTCLSWQEERGREVISPSHMAEREQIKICSAFRLQHGPRQLHKPVTFTSMMSLGHRSLSLHGYGPRHGPQLQHRPKLHHGFNQQGRLFTTCTSSPHLSL